MWLLFYVMDSLSIKLLQEGKQAIQRQPFLHNTNLPTSIPTDNHPSVSHKEFKNIYNKMPQSPTDSPTDFSMLIPTEYFRQKFVGHTYYRQKYPRTARFPKCVN